VLHNTALRQSLLLPYRQNGASLTGMIRLMWCWHQHVSIAILLVPLDPHQWVLCVHEQVEKRGLGLLHMTSIRVTAALQLLSARTLSARTSACARNAQHKVDTIDDFCLCLC
jgi:hypothetical protein